MKWKRFLGTLCCHKAVFLRGVTSTLNSFYATKRQPLLFFNEKCGLERQLASLQQALRFARLPDRSYRCDLSPQGSRGFYVRAEHASLPPHASDMLTTCPGNWWCGDLHPTRFTALSAAPVLSHYKRTPLLE